MGKYLLMIRVWSYFESRPHRPVVFSNADIIIKIYKIRSILLCYCDVIITSMCFSSTLKLCVIRDETLMQALFTKHIEVRICKYRVCKATSRCSVINNISYLPWYLLGFYDDINRHWHPGFILSLEILDNHWLVLSRGLLK